MHWCRALRATRLRSVTDPELKPPQQAKTLAADNATVPGLFGPRPRPDGRGAAPRPDGRGRGPNKPAVRELAQHGHLTDAPLAADMGVL